VVGRGDRAPEYSPGELARSCMSGHDLCRMLRYDSEGPTGHSWRAARGLGVGGGAAAVIESVTSGASTVPVVISGMAFGLGIGLIVACLAPVGSTQRARLGQVDLTELARLVRGENTLQP
jgi:hypothetical protein